MKLRPTSLAPWWHCDFAETVTGESFALDRASILLSAHRSELVIERAQVDSVLKSLDKLAQQATEPTIGAWHRLLWIDLGLSGNGIDYHDVRNSFIPDVIERGVGIPISLAIIGMEVGRRLGLPIFGVGMPGHFLLGYGDPTSHASSGDLLYVDPFNSGTMLDVAGAANRFASMFGPERPFDISYLEPSTPGAMLIRMCANLKQNYARARDIAGLLDIMRLRSCLPDTSITEGRELVRLLQASGLSTDALDVCDQLEQHHPSAVQLIDQERDRVTAQFN
jgi:regulator of sirC expression with transglutaminase-like and TPR domain